MDPSLMRGDGWICCCLCGQIHNEPFPDLYVDEQGVKWDVCRTCAEDEKRALEAHNRNGWDGS